MVQKEKQNIIDVDMHVTIKHSDEIKSRLKQPFYDAYRFKGRGIFEKPVA